MIVSRITAILPFADAPSDVVRLDHDRRRRRRIVYTTEAGRAILLNMHNVVHLRDGNGLVLDDGSMVRVEALAEPLTAITAPDTAALVRIAWHLGNRHLPTQLTGETLLIRDDHVIAAMAEGLGGTCTTLMAAFDPEGGAYKSAGHGHGLAGDHDHDGGHHHHHHDHDPDQIPGHLHG